jgi:hypothetical protein
MAKTRTSELKKMSRGELVRMCNGAGLNHTGSDEQLVERLAAAQVEPVQEAEAEPAAS